VPYGAMPWTTSVCGAEIDVHTEAYGLSFLLEDNLRQTEIDLILRMSNSSTCLRAKPGLQNSCYSRHRRNHLRNRLTRVLRLTHGEL